MKTRNLPFVILALASSILNILAQAPGFVTPPRDQTNAIGTTATFSVIATSALPISYQWRSYSSPTVFTNMPGETNTILVLTDVQTTRRYGVEVSNSSGAVTNQAVLRVGFPVGITQHPASATVEQGTPFLLSVVATGAAPLYYQWYHDGVAVPGLTSNSVYFSSVQLSNAGVYRVTVQNAYAGTNLFGGPTSQDALVDVFTNSIVFTRITSGPVVTDSVAAWNGMWGDYDGDGWLDLVVGGNYRYGARNIQFYHNTGNGQFTRLTNSLITNATDRVSCSPWVDLDNDGDLDIFMTVGGGQETFVCRNQGGGVFNREAAPLNVPARGGTIAWGDYDGDGLLDAFLGISAGGTSSLLHNIGDGTFTVVTNQPMCLLNAFEEASSWIDYDNDGDLDLFATSASMYSTARLYRNNGNGQFTEVTLSGMPNSISGAWADFDNDGDLDLVIANRFYVNQGNGTFLPWTGQPATLTSSGLDAPVWGDYDNDGFLDLFTTAMYSTSCRLFRNLSDGNFMEIRSLSPVTDLGTTQTAAWGDYDNDGFLDLFVATLGDGPNRLYRNDTNTNQWLKIRLKGTVSNSHAVGARVYASATIQGTRMRQMRQITAQSGIQELEVHFGLGDATKAEIIRVEWPSRRVTEWYNVVAGQILTFTEPTNDLPVITAPLRDQTNAIGTTATFEVVATGTPPLSYQWRSYSSPTVFTNMPGETNTILVLTNVQSTRRYGVEVSNTFGAVTNQAVLRVGAPAVITRQPADVAVEPGLPATLLVEASGAAPLRYLWYKDGVPLPGQTSNSIYFSSAQLSNAGLYRVTVQNSYAGTNLFGGPTSREARLRVDWLGVVMRKITNGPVATDRGANFCSVWADYDCDGYPDLFVTRHTLGRSMLYHNNHDGTFSSVTNNVFPLPQGAWREASWGDFDNDGWPDLLVTSEQASFIHYNKHDGTFESVPFDPLVANSIAVGDYDRDGRLDLNLTMQWRPLGVDLLPGTNTLYRNLGGRAFQRMTVAAVGSMVDTVCRGQAAWGDFDDDGWPDLFSGNNWMPGTNYLFKNDGAGRFVIVTNQLTTTSYGLGGAWGDYDNCGRLDLSVVGSGGGGSGIIYQNLGGGNFQPASIGTQLPLVSFSASWADIDNDGFLDLFMAYVTNSVFRNLGDGTFLRITRGPVVEDLPVTVSYGGAWFDYDNDGFLDLCVANGDDYGSFVQVNFLYHNETNSNAWLRIKLVGTASNRDAIGAKVRVQATYAGETRWQRRDISGGGMSQGNHLIAHFGLGNATNAEIVRIEWPSGQVTEMHNVAARQILTVEEPNLVAGRHPSGVQLTLQGRIGSRYDVHTRASLAPTNNWSPWLSVTSTSPVMILTDTNVSGISQRYYKVVQP